MKIKRPIKIVKQPIYPGGSNAIKKIIQENLKYPKAALKNNITGHVVIKYDINYKGVIIKTKVIKSVGHGCDEEAIRLVKLLKFEVPRSRNMKLVFHKTIRIPFHFTKNDNSITVQYNYTSENQKSDNDSNSYNYTVDI